MPGHIFTPQEANKRLPLVKKIVGEIIEKGTQLRTLLENVEMGLKPISAEYLQKEIESRIEELEELGCYYKDWNFTIGLVDFPSMIDGEAVYLCWRSDEPALEWYHGIESGYAARQKIPLHLL